MCTSWYDTFSQDYVLSKCKRTDIQSCSKLRIQSIVYQTARHNPGSANVMITLNKQITPAKIVEIYLIRSSTILIAVWPHIALDQDKVQHDPYRHWPLEVSGRLFQDTLGSVVLIELQDLKGHFGKTSFSTDLLGEHIHVLPIAKVGLASS